MNERKKQFLNQSNIILLFWRRKTLNMTNMKNRNLIFPPKTKNHRKKRKIMVIARTEIVFENVFKIQRTAYEDIYLLSKYQNLAYCVLSIVGYVVNLLTPP